MSDFTPLEGPVKSRKFLVFDIESKADDTQDAGFTRPFLVGVYEGETYKEFRDARPGEGDWESRYYEEGGCIDRAMREILRQKYRGWHIYAHNGGRFDFLFLLPWLRQVGWDLGFRWSIIPVSSSIQVLDVWKMKKGKGGEVHRAHRWRFLDSFKLIPTSLDKAAKAFGQSGKVQHDLDMEENDPHWSVYLEADCVQLYGVLQKFHGYVENVLLGEVGITAPSTAMKIFRRNYLKASIPRSIETHEFVRRGYVGGRVEVFEKLATELRYFDINSSYPASMLEDMPTGPGFFWDGAPPSRCTDGGYIGFCEVDVEVPEMHVPPLPLKHEKTGKLLFPTGRLRGVWDWAELQMAMEVGARITKWHKSVWYAPSPLFREFVTELYKYRDKSRADYDVGLAEVVKIMLNATYGKFGMKTLRRKIYCHDDPTMPENAVPVNGNPDSILWVAEEETDAPYIMPQIAAHVTSLSRIRLYTKVFKAACCKSCWPERCRCKNHGILAYGDTDSGLTPTMLETGTALGELKDEFPEQSGKLIGMFMGPKTYILTTDDNPEFFWEGDYFERVKAKGIEQKDQDVLLRLAAGERIFQSRLEKVGTLARAGFERGPRMRQIPRRILSTEGKRQMHEDGSTSPYKIEMW